MNCLFNVVYFVLILNDHFFVTQLCTQKLRILIEDSDHNRVSFLQQNNTCVPDELSLASVSSVAPVFSRAVKYLGLLAMSRILGTYPKSVQAHKDLILHCLDDRDESIRIRALDLLYGMVRTRLVPRAHSAAAFTRVPIRVCSRLSLQCH